MSNAMYKAQSILYKGSIYRLGDRVLVAHDNTRPHGTHESTKSWRAIITTFFVHDFGQEVGVFFQAEYQDQRFLDETSTELILHPVSYMGMVNLSRTNTQEMTSGPFRNCYKNLWCFQLVMLDGVERKCL